MNELGGPPELRASDADRERVVDLLGAHAAAGRLDPEELERRTGAALAARTLRELAPLTADLPEEGGRSAPTSRQRRRGGSVLRGEARAYLAVMALLVAIWALTGAGYFWPVWPALGWGVGLLSPGGCARRSGRRAGARRATG